MKKIIVLSIIVFCLIPMKIGATTYQSSNKIEDVASYRDDNRKIIIKYKNNEVKYKYIFNLDNVLLRREMYNKGVKRQVVLYNKQYIKNIYYYNQNHELTKISTYQNGVLVRDMKIININAKSYTYYYSNVKTHINYYYKQKLDRKITYKHGQLNSIIQYENGKRSYLLRYKDMHIISEDIYNYHNNVRYVEKRIYYRNGDYYKGYVYNRNGDIQNEYDIYRNPDLINKFY